MTACLHPDCPLPLPPAPCRHAGMACPARRSGWPAKKAMRRARRRRRTRRASRRRRRAAAPLMTSEGRRRQAAAPENPAWVSATRQGCSTANGMHAAAWRRWRRPRTLLHLLADMLLQGHSVRRRECCSRMLDERGWPAVLSRCLANARRPLPARRESQGTSRPVSPQAPVAHQLPCRLPVVSAETWLRSARLLVSKPALAAARLASC